MLLGLECGLVAVELRGLDRLAGYVGSWQLVDLIDGWMVVVVHLSWVYRFGTLALVLAAQQACKQIQHACKPAW